jgi:hypothetical protein
MAVNRLQFTSRKLSTVIRKEFEQTGGEPSRAQLQEIGDQLRETGGAAALAERTVAALEADEATRTRIDLFLETASDQALAQPETI